MNDYKETVSSDIKEVVLLPKNLCKAEKKPNPGMKKRAGLEIIPVHAMDL